MSFLEIAIRLVLATQASGGGEAGTLEARLRTEDPTALARDAAGWAMSTAAPRCSISRR